MAKEPIIMLWCDPCLEQVDGTGEPDGMKVEGTTKIVGSPSGLFEVELCDVHQKSPLPEVEAWAEEHGRPYEPAEAKARAKAKSSSGRTKSTSTYEVDSDGRQKCPFCTETRSTPGRLDNHILKDHPGAKELKGN